jgi:hypothetical protein
MGGACGTNGGEEERARGKEKTRKSESKVIDNTKLNLLEIGMSVVGWIGLALNRYRRRALVNTVMNLRVP